jgi:hypothetical protein
MVVGSVGVGFFIVSIGCETASQIQLPLSIGEPVNPLVTGGSAVKTDVTVPEFGSQRSVCTAAHEPHVGIRATRSG